MTPPTLEEAVAMAEGLILATVNDGNDKPFDRCSITLWALGSPDGNGVWNFNDSVRIGVRVAEIDLQWGTPGVPPCGGDTWMQSIPGAFPIIFAAERYILDLVRESSTPDEIVDTEYWLTQAVKDSHD